MQLQLPHSKADIFSRGVPRSTAASCARLAMCTTAAVCGPVSLQVAPLEQKGVLYMFLLLMMQSVACVGHDMRQQLRTVTTQSLVSWHLWSGQVIASLHTGTRWAAAIAVRRSDPVVLCSSMPAFSRRRNNYRHDAQHIESH